jgi:glycosyltransferase involved in cell wall biosynthesis
MNIGLITYPIERSPAGVGTHVLKLVENLLAIDQENTYFLLHYTPGSNPIYCKNEVLYQRLPYLPVMVSDSWFLHRNRVPLDIVHRFSPGGFLLPVKSKVVVTVHDLFLYKRYPFNRSLKLYFARWANRKSMQKADALVAVSEFTRQEIILTLPVDPQKVHVIHNGPGHVDVKMPCEKRRLSSHYRLENEYLLFVSTIEPRKNLLNLVKAYEILKDRYSIKEDLVVIGQVGWDYQETLRYIEKSRHRNGIRMVGFVPASDLCLFYRHARLFVYPSYMEGFGIPALEAMSCGCPVLTSNTSSLPEVVHYPEMMFDPQDTDEIAAMCLRLLRDSAARDENVRLGAENARRFSWKKSAEQLVRLYQMVGGALSANRRL